MNPIKQFQDNRDKEFDKKFGDICFTNNYRTIQSIDIKRFMEQSDQKLLKTVSEEVEKLELGNNPNEDMEKTMDMGSYNQALQDILKIINIYKK